MEVVLESSNNNNFVGSVLHPLGNIAESLLKEGLAKCVDWSIAKVGHSTWLVAKLGEHYSIDGQEDTTADKVFRKGGYCQWLVAKLRGLVDRCIAKVGH